MTKNTTVNKTQLVVLALYELGGEGDLEGIAVRAHEMFPTLFCWRRYPQFPDKDAVRVHLSEAKKPSAGQLVTDQDMRKNAGDRMGRIKRFALTGAGISRARQLKAVHDRQAVTARKRPLDYSRMIQPIFDSEAFREFRDGSVMRQIGRDSFLAAFKLFPDASAFVASGRLARIEHAIEALPDPEESSELKRFILEGRQEFGL